MNEHKRRAYLQAMGIDVWVRRGQASQAQAPVEAEVTPGAAEGALPEVARLDWDDLRARVAGCTLCGLEATRTQTVFGVGDRRADWMFVGEAPGFEEDRQGEPFVGRAGQLLDNMLRALGLAREQVFIANIVKCRPPNNRNPSAEETSACRPYLRRQIELLAPKVIVALGRVAAHNLLATDQALSRLRAREHRYEDTQLPLVVTYHPAYLLRSPEDKRKAWQDLQLAQRVVAAS